MDYGVDFVGIESMRFTCCRKELLFYLLKISIYFFALMQRSNKKDQGCIKKPKNFKGIG